MAAPITKGRMIRRSISDSQKFASLSKESQVLFCLIIPHLNSHGKYSGSPFTVKGEICPLIEWLNTKQIEKCLTEINDKTSLKWFKHGERFFLHAISWKEHQELRNVGIDELPNSTELVQHLNGTSTETSSPSTVPIPTSSLSSKYCCKDNAKQEEKKEVGLAPLDIFNLWNKKACPDLPRATKLTQKRKEKLKSRILEYPELAQWNNFIDLINESKFMCGENDRNWKADFDWLIYSDDNIVKLLEGKYKNTDQKQSKESTPLPNMEGEDFVARAPWHHVLQAFREAKGLDREDLRWFETSCSQKQKDQANLLIKHFGGNEKKAADCTFQLGCDFEEKGGIWKDWGMTAILSHVDEWRGNLRDFKRVSMPSDTNGRNSDKNQATEQDGVIASVVKTRL